MIAGTVAAMAGGDADRYIQIAALAAFAVALLCFIAWLLRLSFDSSARMLCLLFLANTLANLPKAVLAAIVLTAAYGLINLAAMLRIWRISRIDFYAAAIALVAVLLLGIFQGILLAAAASVLLLLARASHPHVAFLSRIPGTDSYSDLDRHPENEQLATVLAFRPEASLLYVNAEAVMDAVNIVDAHQASGR